jgi:hypothetical protein
VTHSLHRQGTKENLTNDFTLFAIPAVGYNVEGSGPKRKKFLEIALRNNVVNVGASNMGNLAQYSPEELLERVVDGQAMQVCFNNREDVVNVLKETVEAGIDISIVVQGIREDVEACLAEAGLKPHTVNHSLGVWGKTDRLPEKDVLEITTMCGHALVSANLVKQCIEDVIAGRKTAREAAKLLSAPCVCGIFNTDRAEALLKRLAERAKGCC